MGTVNSAGRLSKLRDHPLWPTRAHPLRIHYRLLHCANSVEREGGEAQAAHGKPARQKSQEDKA